jgi:hypothetical protein
MDSRELSEQIYKIMRIGSRNLDALSSAHTEIMSLLSENCWLKDTVTGVGEKKFEVVKPIEVDK